jgi:hypothetical protein
VHALCPHTSVSGPIRTRALAPSPPADSTYPIGAERQGHRRRLLLHSNRSPSCRSPLSPVTYFLSADNRSLPHGWDRTTIGREQVTATRKALLKKPTVAMRWYIIVATGTFRHVTTVIVVTGDVNVSNFQNSSNRHY